MRISQKMLLPLIVSLLFVLSATACSSLDGGNAAREDHDVVNAGPDVRMEAENGGAEAQFRLAIMYEQGQGVRQDYSQAVYWYRKAAQQGETGAQHNLGLMYYAGRGVVQSFDQAVKWWKKAADQGEWASQYNLAVMYEIGRGVPVNHDESAIWFRKAAEHGERRAQHKLGVMYAEGKGVPQDYVQAYAWLTLADPDARERRNSIEKEMSATQIEEAQKLSNEYHEMYVAPFGSR